MKLSEFKNTNTNTTKEETKSKNDKEKVKTEQTKKSIEELYDTYKNMNSSELLTQLKKQVENQKKDGSFNFDNLTSSLNQIMPFLNEEQKNNLMTILNQIK